MLLCARSFGKRVLYDREKSSEMTKYSVPGFGGHIAFSDDVTIYPFLVMSRTVHISRPLLKHAETGCEMTSPNLYELDE